jgi:flagellar hook-associated protein 1 FlgK
MVSLQEKSLTAISGNTLGQYYGDIVGGVGFDISGAQNSLEVESFLLESLDARRDQVSGVNLDEELVNIIEYEQAFAAAAQFIQVVNQLNDEILSLI